MQLVRREPWWMAELERDVDRLFGRALRRSPVWYPLLPMAEPDRWVPACDVFTREGDLGGPDGPAGDRPGHGRAGDRLVLQG
jgi:hypothetical protein